MPTLANLTSLLPSGAKLADLLPTPARLYLETVLQGKKGPITEADFSADELDAMRALVAAGQSYDKYRSRPQGGVDYGTYGRATPSPSMFNSPLTTEVGIAGLLTPQGRVANSLGQFNYSPDGSEITDTYDFNPTYTTDTPLLQALQALSTGGFSALHSLGELRVPPGQGRPVRIRLPARAPNE